ncbi:Gfo/Idh/MocA family protein [Flaviflexus huanghaiensis]|uniref:Gfo/Idh/MocA family protein n=1 Tax=Flaviflexus huanghaiensis TaxID=1111473 RepID=UPI0015FCEDB6|nr:Gfo/Idh/MocA family oxidoreductase [Flaviflexus huanghaiensis]
MTLRAGIIGIGSMGRHHARVIRETEGMELVAIADPGGDKFGVAKGLDVLPDVDALIDAGIDTAMVAVPTVYHEDVAIKLAEAGIHTMVEKPIAHDVEAGRRVAEAFDKPDLVGAVGYVERCNPAIMALREKLADGILGEIYQIQTRRQGPFPARISDVGVVKDLATHDIDLTAYVAQSEYENVAAQTSHRSGREFEDMVLVTGRLKNGIIVNHVVNWLSPFKERLTLVTGERGALLADTLNNDLTFYENGTVRTQWDAVAQFRGVSEGAITRFAIEKREPLKVEQERFRDAVNGLGHEIVTMVEGVKTLEVIQAILDSARTGQSVSLSS